MGRFFTLPFQDVLTSAAAGTWFSIAGLITANTAGHRARLRKISVTPGGALAAQDVNVNLMLIRTNNATAGTPGSSPTPTKIDPNSLASILTAGVNYGASEPTTFETTALSIVGINGRGGWVEAWGEADAFKWGQNQTLVLRATPGVATAVTLSGYLEYEEW